VGLIEGLLGRRRASAARRVGLFMAVALGTGIALTVGGAVSGNQPLLFTGVGLLVVALLPLFFVGDLINSLVLGMIRSAARAKRAAELGLRYARHDPFGLERLGFLGLGDGSAEHVTWGTVDGRAFLWFEWSRGLVGREGSYACAAFDLEADCAPLVLARTGTGPDVSLPEVELEAVEFNRAFDVACPDRRFATAFCDAPLMAWMLDAWPADVLVEARGRHVVCWTRDVRRFPGIGTVLAFVLSMLGRGADAPERVLASARELASRVPRVVASLWPATSAPLAPAAEP
jgi:hypothetical protein